MRLLWLSHVVPYPPVAGVLLRAYHLLRGVASVHEVDLVAFVQRPLLAPVYPDLEDGLAECKRELATLCRSVTFLPITKAERPLGRLRTAVASVASPYGYVGSWLYSAESRIAIQQATAGRRYDLIHLDSISLSRYRSLFPGVPATLGHHNSESHMLYRRAKNAVSLGEGLYFRLEAPKLARLEHRMAKQFCLHITCSDLDNDRLRNTMPEAPLETFPNGVDTEFFKPINTPERPNSLVFVGTMNWYPNIDAVMFLLRDVWPSLRQRIPDVTLDIVGAGAPDNLRTLAAACPGVTLHGFVRDIRPLVDSAALYVCPIRDGGGTKLKILDALAMQRCVVAHPIACEGIDVEGDFNVAFASSPTEYVDRIASLLGDPELRKRISIEGRELVVSRYSFSTIASALAKRLAECATQKNSPQ